MKTYTTKDIENYLNYLIKTFPYSNTENYAKAFKFMIFAESGLNNFEKVFEKIKEGG